MSKSFIFQWTGKDGVQKIAAAVDYATNDDAHRAAIDLAKQHGYEPPKWWQFWKSESVNRKIATH